MAALSGNRIAWLYTDDFGNVYRVAAQKALTDQGVLGGTAAVGTELERPQDFKMRRITVHNSAGASRVLPMYTPGATIKTAGTAVNANHLGNSTAFVSFGSFIPEQRRKQNVTAQTA